MRILKLTLLLALVGMATSACALLAPSESEATGSRAMETVDQDLRDRVATAMAQAADKFDVSVQSDQAAYLSRNDLTIAHALVAGFDTLALADPDRVAVVGLAYLSLPSGARVIQATGQRTGLSAGFYLVQIRTLEARIRLIAASRQAMGEPAAVLPFERAQTDPSSAPQIMATGCRVELRYVQRQVHRGQPPIRVAAPLDWCPAGL
ncbi:MAG: hypothetical protein ABEK03_08535 [Candidatus Bipolaricaulia bacterium]